MRRNRVECTLVGLASKPGVKETEGKDPENFSDAEIK
jgi:hypothetical protein